MPKTTRYAVASSSGLSGVYSPSGGNTPRLCNHASVTSVSPTTNRNPAKIAHTLCPSRRGCAVVPGREDIRWLPTCERGKRGPAILLLFTFRFAPLLLALENQNFPEPMTGPTQMRTMDLHYQDPRLVSRDFFPKRCSCDERPLRSN